MFKLADYMLLEVTICEVNKTVSSHRYKKNSDLYLLI